jgi:hypothetical protein
VSTEAEINAAVAKLAAAPGGGLMVPPDAYTLSDPHTSRAWRLSSIMRLPWRKVIGVPGQR